MNDHRVIQFPTEAVRKGNALHTYGKQTASAHLENSTSDGADMSKGAFDMSKKRIRQRAKIGDQCVWVSGETQQELFDDYLRQAIAAGLVVPADAVGEARAHKTPTVRQFVEETYAPTFIARLAPKTVVNYRLYLELNILPFLGDMPMDQVTVATIQQFYDWMATAGERGRKKNLNACTIRRVSGLASRIFKVAMEMKIIPETPFKHSLLNIRAEEAGHHKAMTDEEIQRVRQAIPHLQDRNERSIWACWPIRACARRRPWARAGKTLPWSSNTPRWCRPSPTRATAGHTSASPKRPMPPGRCCCPRCWWRSCGRSSNPAASSWGETSPGATPIKRR